MRKNFILDTNVLLHDPNALYKFDDNNILIPIEVIEELDHFKRDMSDLGANARRVVQDLDKLRRGGKLGEGVRLENGGLLRVVTGTFDNVLSGTGITDGKKGANRILSLAVTLNRDEPENATILITKNINLRLKADALGIYAEDYEEAFFRTANGYNGFQEIEVDAGVLDSFRENRTYTFEDGSYEANEYLLLRDPAGETRSEIGRISDEDGKTLTAIHHYGEGVLGVRPLNLAQCFAFDALLDDDIKLVTLRGKAGTGKTLVAVAAGLFKIIKEEKYHKLLVARPTIAMGRDIGYIPGDVEEKLRPWMQPIHDAIELLQDIDRHARKRQLPRDLMEGGDVEVEPLTYIRGRSIPNQYMIIDEAQNLTPLELKTIITRVGFGTKIVLTGDPEQIDHPYMDSLSNGFVYVVNAFRKKPLAAHITLEKGERSDLAELAANLL